MFPPPPLPSILRDLITANHILHHASIVDGYGHISIRHPAQPSVYIMAGYLAPAIVSTAEDMIEYHIADGAPVDPNAKKGYSERYIHGEIFKRFPGVHCVIHSHSEAVIPFMVAGVPLRPAFHMAGFLGESVPTFDITPLYTPTSQRDMLVNSVPLGAALASHFAAPAAPADSALPDNLVVLMRHHGFTTCGESIQDAVFRAIYTHKNAAILSSAATLRAAHGLEAGGLDYLSEQETEGCRRMNEATADKAWRGWVEEVRAVSLYRNVMIEDEKQKE
ncbi:arad-like aldolase/epimerase [Mytilinidion resinicola]|uniref:Arad-like aldolase/epimerase n=1 Tax=Mytilinidion resinicola TaxID=574789 RepID=A0A6A6YUC3_9PEZI|nr:arad-like aldolase/epimerase [Mytilinidion resinicola]KAF2812360.1 arad-like aldolase/epimerase [Mytilinidion resinicola]